MQGQNNEIKSILRFFLYKGELDLAEKRKRQLFVVFQLFSIPGFLTFGIAHFSKGKIMEGCFNILVVLLMIGAIVVLKQLRQGIVVFRSFGLIFSVLFIYWLWVGIANGNASLWILILPLYFFHYFGKTEGIIWTTICFLFCLIVFFIPYEFWETYQYSNSLKIRFIAVYTVLSVFTYHYESIRERFWNGMKTEREQLLAEKEKSETANAALTTANRKLENEMNERAQAEIALQKARDNLEIRVEERTMELMRTNEDLRQEIEERYRAEENLRNSEENFIHLANLLPQTIFEVDKKGMITFLNLSGHKFTEYTRKDLKKGLQVSEMFIPEEKEKLKDSIQKIMDNKPRTVNEFTVLSKNKKASPVLIYARKIKKSSKPGGIRGIVVNITKRKEFEHEILTAKEVAENANIAKNNFLANMSHELRTPMNGVLGLTELLLFTTLTDQQREYIEAISHSGNALLKIMNDILDLSRIEANKLEIEQLDFNLRKIIKKNVTLFSGSAAAKGLKLSHQIQDDVPNSLIGDSVRLGQILSNTLSNAIKFTETGEVRLSVILVEKTEKSVILRFEVTDTGIGISEDNLPHIFQSFTQADSSPTRKYGGAGLGLTIVKNIIDLMGGKIGVDSKIDSGTTFWFELGYTVGKSQVQEASQSISHPDEIISPKNNNLKLLVVDDDLLNRLIVSEMLEKLGYTVDASISGKDALNQLEQDIYSLIFMDCLMPEMDGYETTRRIRKLKNKRIAYENIPIIALTAKAMKGDKERCLNAGMDDYLTKPVSLMSLKQILEKHLI